MKYKKRWWEMLKRYPEEAHRIALSNLFKSVHRFQPRRTSREELREDIAGVLKKRELYEQRDTAFIMAYPRWINDHR